MEPEVTFFLPYFRTPQLLFYNFGKDHIPLRYVPESREVIF